MVIKKGTCYTLLQTNDGLVFLDVKNYVPPGLSLNKTLKTYNTSADKGYFPYSLLNDPSFFDSSTMPGYSTFDSTLKGMNTLEDTWSELTKHNFAHKWKPIVYSCAIGHLSSETKGQEKILKHAYMQQALFRVLIDGRWNRFAETMEPKINLSLGLVQKKVCSVCCKEVDFLLPDSRQCMQCFEPEAVVMSSDVKVKVTRSRDDSYLTT